MNYLFLIFMTMLGAVAGFYLKKASGSDGLMSLIRNKHLYIGGFLYLFSAVINIILLRVLPYSVVLPLTAITYIWTMFLSNYLLKEIITPKKIVGIAAILLGAFLVAV